MKLTVATPPILLGREIMIFAPQIGLTPLERLCHRMYTALHAGLSVRKVCKREADSESSFALRKRMIMVSETVSEGGTVREGLDRC
ncbi:MAG: hypothetical protein N2C14_04710, partial [Planctomycetales bacterium]